MSLYIIGSVSRITSNIVLQLAKNNQYSRITIADLLPCYSFHKRFYRLQRELDNMQYKTQVNLEKIHSLNDLLKHETYEDVLYVTHDYYEMVVSKTRLMELTALICKNRQRLYFATPVEYDHFGYVSPQSNYTNSQNKVFELNKNSTIIRSDVQDKTQSLAYFTQPQKNFFQKKVFESKFYFSPNVVNAQYYARVVADVMAKAVKGKRILVKGGETKDPVYIDVNKEIEKEEYQHCKQNVVGLAQKYNGFRFANYQNYQLKQQKQSNENINQNKSQLKQDTK